MRIERVRVWSGWLRLSHAAMGLSTLVLLCSGWLLSHAPTLHADMLDVHYLAAGILLAGMALRVLLMFVGTPLERLGQLMPEDDEWRSVGDMLRFYLSLGRATLPRWYAHNPLWKPLYLLMYVCLLVLLFSGWLRADTPLIWGLYLPRVHEIFAIAVGCLSGLHLFTVVWHDYRGDASDVSAMVNGHRHFVIETPPGDSIRPLASVSIQDIGVQQRPSTKD